jgi:hypothetical protein
MKFVFAYSVIGEGSGLEYWAYIGVREEQTNATRTESSSH